MPVVGLTLISSVPSEPVIKPASSARGGAFGGVEAANSYSFLPAISANGALVAYTSHASDLASGDTNELADIFVYIGPGISLLSRTSERVSIASDGTQANNRLVGVFTPYFFEETSAISGTGRYVAFASIATNLVPNDVNGTHDVFVYDRFTDTMQRVSLAGAGDTPQNSGGASPSLSADGRFVAFTSDAANIAPGIDNNSFADVIVFDRNSSTTERVSMTSGGGAPNGSSFDPSISGDGRFVAFSSNATNLAAASDTNGEADIFIHDRVTHTTQLVSKALNGATGNALTQYPAISANGHFVTFHSNSSNLVVGDTNTTFFNDEIFGGFDIFVYDRVTNAVERVSVASNGTEAQGDSSNPTISADGRYVTFTSSAKNLVSTPVPAEIAYQVYVHDRLMDTTELISQTPGGVVGYGQSYAGSINADGRYVSFSTGATNLGYADSNGYDDVYRVDRGDTQPFPYARDDYLIKTYSGVYGLQTDIVYQGTVTPANTSLALTYRNLAFFDQTFRLDGANLNNISNVAGTRFDDVLLQNEANGQVLVARMADGAFQGWGAVTGALGDDWTAVTTGNVNPAANGGAEVFIQQQSTGTIYYAGLLGGATTWGVVSSALTPDWKLRAVGDINRDGSVDAVVQEASTGTILYANMANGTFSGWNAVNQALDSNWLAVGAGDVNADGYADVIIQNQQDGSTLWADMRFGQFQGWGVITQAVTADYKVKAVADVDGNGYADVIFQEGATGNAYYAAMSSDGFSHWGIVALNTEPGAGWCRAWRMSTMTACATCWCKMPPTEPRSTPI